VLTGAFKEKMKVILHNGVRQNFELTLLAGTQYLLCEDNNNGGIEE
jgi:hypothetical protein